MRNRVMRYGLQSIALLSSACLSSFGWAQEAETVDPLNPSPACRVDESCAQWVKFRTRHPSTYQTIAVGLDQSSTTVVLSEPAPVLNREALDQLLKQVFGEDLKSIVRYRMPTGIDGWVEDVVLSVRTEEEPQVEIISGDTLQAWNVPDSLADRLRFVAKALNGTGDAFWIDNLKAPPLAARIDELRIAPSMILKSVAATAAAWQSLGPDAAVVTSASLREATKAGAYVRADGLVALVVPPRHDIAALETPFRRFAVASDLLVGAARTANGPLILLGRTRRLPMSVLPPMRFETFASLALNREEELAQSYERRRIFAGKIQDGDNAGWDWAPILLSAQLDDSEFGTLLNHADQILKSWSQKGKVEYHSFNYPKPSAFPFGAEAASDYFKRAHNADALVFNWNTDDFATLVQFKGVETLTVDRSNALPILYIPTSNGEVGPDGTDRLAKDIDADATAKAAQARTYFAGLGNPVLVQVARYVLLAQATRSLWTPPYKAAPIRRARSDVTASLLETEAREWIGRMLARQDLPLDLRSRLDRLQRTQTPTRLAEIIAMPQKAEADASLAFKRYARNRRALNARLPERWELVGRIRAKADESDIQRQRYDALAKLWDRKCVEYGGTLSTNNQGVTCRSNRGDAELKSINAQMEAVSRTRKSLSAHLTSMDTQLSALDSKLDALALATEAEEKRYKGTVTLLREVSALREGFTALSGVADLAAIHTRLLAATQGPTPGAIRTPSIVLSQSPLMPELVGGHNIGLRPNRARVATGLNAPRRVDAPDNVSIVEAPIDQIDRTPSFARSEVSAVAEVSTTPIKPGGDTLLARMRAHVRVPDDATLLADAARCLACDAVAFRRPDGSIFLVRTKPAPPRLEQVFGKSGLIDVLGGPPRASTVEFNGFSTDVIGDVTAAIAGARGKGGGTGGWGSRFGKGATPPDGQPRIYVVDHNGQPRTLAISGGSRGALDQTINARSGMVTAADEAGWSSRFRSPAPEGLKVIVDFSDARSLGIAMKGSDQPGLSARLIGAVRGWLGRAAPTPMPARDAILGLRDVVRTELPHLDSAVSLDFYLREGADLIRVARQPPLPINEG